MPDRWLIAGLGNPGPEYSHNRHNVGYWCVNRLARLHGINLKARGVAALGSGKIGDADVLLVKPRTYMNRSGEAIGPAMRQFNATPQHVIVMYDELDLPLGRLRIRFGGGSGGHNGIKSIIAGVGSQEFTRIRIGIGRPHPGGEPSWDPKDVSEWVLGDPTAEQAKTLQDAVSRAVQAVEMIIAEGVEAAMGRYNG